MSRHRTVPSARQMELSRQHHMIFIHNELIDIVVELQPDGLWAAGYADDPERGWPGSGDSAINAVIDLIEQIAN